jgi:hypothetical protein
VVIWIDGSERHAVPIPRICGDWNGFTGQHDARRDALPSRCAISDAPRAAGYHGSDFVQRRVCDIDGRSVIRHSTQIRIAHGLGSSGATS